MTRAHDLGGRSGFGPVDRSEHPGVFAYDWERIVFGLTFATLAQGIYSTDENRYARECMEPAAYLGSRYYELWFAALETNLVDKDVVTFGEVARSERDLQDGAASAVGVGPAGLMDNVRAAVFGGVSSARPPVREPAFGVGEEVRARPVTQTGHTRLPEYVWGKTGVVTRVSGPYVFPDSNAHHEGEQPQHVYTVELTARELWGNRAEPHTTVRVDAWERYLEPAEKGRAA